MGYRPSSRIWAPSALTVSAVTTADLKDHLRVTHALEDGVIGAYGLAATAAIEKATQRLMQVRAATLRLQCLPTMQEAVELPGGPVAIVTSVTADGVAITGCAAIGDSPAILMPAADWPVVVGTGYAVTIIYQAGHATPPQDLVHAIKLLVSHWYENRAAVGDMKLSEVPLAVQMLVGLNRIAPAR